MVSFHSVVTSGWFYFGIYVVLSNAISAMPAPTATSSFFYLWLFKFANGVASNLPRAWSTTLEGSPNWTAALKQAQQQGGNKQ